MTTRARRRQAAKRAVRWRKQAARLIDASQSTGPRRHGADRRIVQILRGDDDARFDVALARAYCKRLLAEADELDMQREVFADWTRMRGAGPENRDGGAFVSPAHYWRVDFNIAADTTAAAGEWSVSVDGFTACTYYADFCEWVHSVSHTLARLLLDAGVSTRIPQYDSLIVSGKRVTASAPDGVQARVRRLGPSDAPPRGGWPGKLAHEYVAFKRAKRKCSRRDCDGGVLTGNFAENAAASLAATGRVTITGSTTDGCGVACPECERFAEAPMPHTFANGGNLRRAAQRLLDTLDGRCPWNDAAEAQPDECDACDGRGETGPEWPAPHGAVVSVVISPGVRDGQPREARIGEQLRVSCHACSGTGHNLRGTLPPLSEATRRKLQHDGRRSATRIAEHMQATLVGMPERLLFPERNTRLPVDMSPLRAALPGRVEAVDLSSVTLFPEDPT